MRLQVKTNGNWMNIFVKILSPRCVKMYKQNEGSGKTNWQLDGTMCDS